MTDEFPTQRASDAENVSIWWRHHMLYLCILVRHVSHCYANRKFGFGFGFIATLHAIITDKYYLINTSRSRHNDRYFPDGIFKCIFSNENIWFLIKIILKCVHKGSIKNIPALVQIMDWHRPSDKPSSNPNIILDYRRMHASLGLKEFWSNLCPPGDPFTHIK